MNISANSKHAIVTKMFLHERYREAVQSVGGGIESE